MAYDVWKEYNNYLHDKVECNARVTLYPQVEYYDPATPVTYLDLLVDKNDPEYIGNLFADVAWTWWRENADDIDYPSAASFFDHVWETYCSMSNDRTGAFVHDFYAIAWEIAYNKIRDYEWQVQADRLYEIYGPDPKPWM